MKKSKLAPSTGPEATQAISESLVVRPGAMAMSAKMAWPARGGAGAQGRARAAADEESAHQLKKLVREWIIMALDNPQSMVKVAVQFRYIVEGFWPFNNPSKMNVPHPEVMAVVVEELKTILELGETPTEGFFPCAATQPRSLATFCNFVLLLGDVAAEFNASPFAVPAEHWCLLARACALCVLEPLQLPMAQALLLVWRLVGREMEARLPQKDFWLLVNGVRDAVLYGHRAHLADGDRNDPKEVLVQALELRARGWRSAAQGGVARRGGGDEVPGSPLEDALARVANSTAAATAAADALGAAGDWAPASARARSCLRA